MSFQLDPVYHTKTMVLILRKQGHIHLALNLAEKILENQPHLEEVQIIYRGLKEEIQKTFDKFLKSNTKIKDGDVEHCSIHEKKIALLETILKHIQNKRVSIGS